MNIDVAAALEAANKFAESVLPLFAVLGVIAGLVLIRSAAMELMGKGKRADEDVNFMTVAIRLAIAGVFFQFAVSVNWTTALLGGDISSSRESMALIIQSSNPIWNKMLDASFMWLKVIGVAAIFRGFIKWNAAAGGESQGKDEFWGGLWHIIGGAVLINLSG